MTSKRNTKTKAKIERSFLQLMEDKGFNQLTVKDITQLAQINRSTFYLNYADKYDLLAKIEAKLFQNIHQILKLDKTNSYFDEASILAVLNYALANHRLVKVLTEGDLASQVESLLKQEIIAIVEEQLHVNFNQDPIVNSPYAREIFASSISAIIILWIKRDFQESVEEIMQILESLRQYSLGQIINEGK
ncbi:TetR/AcrR family transcriptional regulator [uncultured Limosilactobacillus sp.]|uniref:TetR/AcrR family transcriptional regulator n=1 Tax=uncultured Limosilactobacillus sp. TaxID=2837629 RepID=UPI0025D9448C|nr:TetR/AcrR family transcriptional regulator C-terminal domain-containing protein [uncultured Limosilactobacillus sp.]